MGIGISNTPLKFLWPARILHESRRSTENEGVRVVTRTLIFHTLKGSLCPGGGGGTLIFSAYVGSDPASTVHPKKYQEFQAPQKIFEILATPKNIPILYLDLKKRP